MTTLQIAPGKVLVKSATRLIPNSDYHSVEVSYHRRRLNVPECAEETAMWLGDTSGREYTWRWVEIDVEVV